MATEQRPDWVPPAPTTPQASPDYDIQVSIGPPEAETGERPQRPAADAAQAQPTGPEIPIDLSADPYGESAFTGEAEQVAGRGKSIVDMVLRAFGRGGDTPPPKGDAPQPEAAPEGETLPDLPPREGKVMGPQPVMGTTRDLPNPAYYQSEESKQVFAIMAERGRTPDPVSWDTTRARAESEEVQKLLGKEPSLAWSPEQVYKLRQIADAQAREFKTLADELAARMQHGIEPGTEQLAEFERLGAELTHTTNTIAGIQTEVGRLLQSQQMTVSSSAEYARELAEQVRQRGGKHMVKQRIKVIAKMSPDKVARNAQGTLGERTLNGLYKLRYNMMLSSFRTHVANVLGSTASLAWENVVDIGALVNNRLLLRPASAALERLTRPLANTRFAVRTQEALPWASFNAQMAGARHGTQSGLKLFWNIAKGNPDVVDHTGGIGKFVNEIGVRTGQADFFADAKSPLARGAGRLANLPTRLLEAEDAAFRAIAYDIRLRQVALDRAHVEAGDDLVRRQALYESYLENPTDEMRRQARDHAAKITYTNDTSAYGSGLHFFAQIAARVGNTRIGNLILPFVRTPANLTGYAMEQLGGGLMTRPWKTLEQLSGINATAREQAEAWTRVQIAYGLFEMMGPLHGMGLFTGMGSTNYNVNQVMEAKGWRPNSVRIGDTWYQLNRLDPVGQIFAMHATALEFAEQYADAAPEQRARAMMAALLSTADVLQERSFLSGAVEAMQLMEGGPKSVDRALNMGVRAATSFVLPNILRDFRQAADPVQRSLQVDYTVEGMGGGAYQRFLNVMKNAVPYGSEHLPPRIDWMGNIITTEGNKFWRGMMPITMGVYNEDDAATGYLLANDVVVNRPSHEIILEGTYSQARINLLEIDPSGYLYAAYQQKVGKHRLEMVKQVITQQGFLDSQEAGFMGRDTPGGRELSRALSRGQKKAKGEMLQWMLDGGGPVEVFPGSLVELDPTRFPRREELIDAVKLWMQQRERTDDVPGLRIKSKPQYHVPDALMPRF